MNFSKYSDNEIKKRVSMAIDILMKMDSYLLINGVSERSVSHELAVYLQNLFSDWHVDCEFNRKGPKTKELDGIHECSEQKETDRVYPDIIIHQRGQTNNLLVIETKTQNEDVCDRKKLELFTKSEGDYKYQLGLYILFKGINPPQLQWYKNGSIHERRIQRL